MSKDEEEQSNDDISIDITNGKKVKINLDPVEWAIVSGAICVFAWLTGWML